MPKLSKEFGAGEASRTPEVIQARIDELEKQRENAVANLNYLGGEDGPSPLDKADSDIEKERLADIDRELEELKRTLEEGS